MSTEAAAPEAMSPEAAPAETGDNFSTKLKMACVVFALLAFLASWPLSQIFNVSYDNILSGFVFCGGIGVLLALKAVRPTDG